MKWFKVEPYNVVNHSVVFEDEEEIRNQSIYISLHLSNVYVHWTDVHRANNGTDNGLNFNLDRKCILCTTMIVNKTRLLYKRVKQAQLCNFREHIDTCNYVEAINLYIQAIYNVYIQVLNLKFTFKFKSFNPLSYKSYCEYYSLFFHQKVSKKCFPKKSSKLEVLMRIEIFIVKHI